MAPNISIREYIRWLPDIAKEPTTTVVLTSKENRFVDIRILKPTSGDEDDEATGGVLHTSRLDWAFAGISSTELRPDPNSNATAIVHSTWHHWVDSRTRNAESVTDEGDMYPQADGERTLEYGEMVNPATGQMTAYEECWRDVEPTTTTTTMATTTSEGGSGEGEGEGRRICVFLQLWDEENEVRGMVVRVGQFCQGVLRVRGSFSLERWEWKENSDGDGGGDGGWKREVRIGDLWIPCGVVLEGERLKLGGEIRYGDFLWEVVEMSEF